MPYTNGKTNTTGHGKVLLTKVIDHIIIPKNILPKKKK